MKQSFYKLLLCSVVAVGMALPVKAQEFHSPFFVLATFDVGSAAGRILSTAVKYFLSDDTNLVAELVWKEGSSCGGCGGCYGGNGSTTDPGSTLELSAVFEDISVEEDIYRDSSTIGTSCVAYLAQDRVDDCVVDQASLNALSDRAWAIQYQSQRRSIQALTDALNMKRLYSNIKDIATSSKTDYSNYSAAVSSVASKRLLLDQLLALKKRVVAARVRIRAQTLELNSVDLKLVTTPPDLTMICKQ